MAAERDDAYEAERERPGKHPKDESIRRCCIARSAAADASAEYPHPTTLMQPIVAQLKPVWSRLRRGASTWCRCGLAPPISRSAMVRTGDWLRADAVRHAGQRRKSCSAVANRHGRRTVLRWHARTNLPGGSPLDDPYSEQNRAVPTVEARSDGRRMLNGGCYVLSPSVADMQTRDALQYCAVISGDSGALYQAQFYLQLAAARSPVVACGERHAILFVKAGRGSVIISGRRFDIAPTDGVYIRPGEAFQLVADSGSTLEVFVSACPLGDLDWLESMPMNFDATFPVRVATGGRGAARKRWVTILSRPWSTSGSAPISSPQFIGHIPQSKPAPHRHLYEEALIVLNGAGYMWTE